MPVNKSVFKKQMNFTGMTEYLGKLNNKKTIMLMYGEKFSVIPITTHINLKDVNKRIKTNIIHNKLKYILRKIDKEIYNLKIKNIKFLCFNPHCSENGTLGKEDNIIKKSLLNFKTILWSLCCRQCF
jgi:4-hydroxy-L-threonine phosphate dehydrogenase PdxA